MRMALMPSISFEIGDAAGTEIWAFRKFSGGACAA